MPRIKPLLIPLAAAAALTAPLLALAHGISDADRQRMLDGGLLQYIGLGASHMLTGYGDGEDAPSKPIELVEGAVESARAFLRGDSEVQERIARVAALLDGYEDPYGMELLSSVHWVMCHVEGARGLKEWARLEVRETAVGLHTCGADVGGVYPLR